MTQSRGSLHIDAPPVYIIEHASETNFLVILICVIILKKAVILTPEILFATLIRSREIF
jgi:hypothetical protein